METDLVTLLNDVVSGAGMVAFVIWLYWHERKDHHETRRELRAVLREIAGLEVKLQARRPPPSKQANGNGSD